jgi:hypothetical protein
MRAALVLASIVLLAGLAGCVAQGGAPEKQGRIVAGAPIAPQDPGWAPLDAAKIRPGDLIHTETGDCLSNFVFTRPDNTSVFVGTTAYCVRALHVGSLASIGAKDNIAVLIYSSFETMDEVHETDSGARNYNDFAVFRVDDHDRKWVNPALLRFGGPVGVADFASVGSGARVRTFANLSDGLPDAAHERQGVIAAPDGAWGYLVYGEPTLPGQTGAGVTTPEGKAVGVMVSLGVVPSPGANGVARLDKLMAYADEHAKLPLRLMTWDLLAPGALASTASPQS